MLSEYGGKIIAVAESAVKGDLRYRKLALGQQLFSGRQADRGESVGNRLSAFFQKDVPQV